MNRQPPVHLPVADAVRRHWADRILPEQLKPYARLARLERPIGWWLLLLPGWWGIALAEISQGGGLPDLMLLLLFLIGAIAMRGAGSTFNDIVDRDFDARVERTKRRPLPSGQVGVAQAVAFLLLELVIGLAVLMQLNRYSIVLGASSLVLIAVYPFVKRVSYWPQLFLGLAFNWGALIGWSAVTGGLTLPAYCLYAGGVFWTLAYDTIYAHQDKDDDMLIGVKSTALKFGDATPYWLALFFVGALASIGAAGVLTGAGLVFQAGVAAAMLHAGWQLAKLDIDDADRCLLLFRSNRDLGLLIFGAAAAASVLQGASGQ